MASRHPREPIPPYNSQELIQNIHHVLTDLYSHPYPEVPSPPNLPKRASVALIIRINPHYEHWPDTKATNRFANGETITFDSAQERLDAFFAQDWVKHGDPEVLFIKRAARKGDKWTGHIALPGGRRDPEDADDKAAAVRETSEEVGLDLTDDVAMNVGNLPQKVITMAWGKTPLMVLCPYVFLLTTPNIPALRLQPTEVASAHWVPIRALLAPSQRTYWYQDVSSRTSRQEFGFKRWFHRAMTGKMMFAAVRLVPSQTVYCSNIAEFMPISKSKESAQKPRSSKEMINVTVPLLGSTSHTAPSPTDHPLLLWGLTLGVMGDFLDLLPTDQSLGLWVYPTFTPYDLRFILWALSFNFRRQKQTLFQQGYRSTRPPAVELGMDSIGTREDSNTDMSIESNWPMRVMNDKRGSRSEFVSVMLEGYYTIIRRAVILAVLGRLSVASILVFLASRRLTKQSIVDILWTAFCKTMYRE